MYLGDDVCLSQNELVECFGRVEVKGRGGDQLMACFVEDLLAGELTVQGICWGAIASRGFIFVDGVSEPSVVEINIDDIVAEGMVPYLDAQLCGEQ